LWRSSQSIWVSRTSIWRQTLQEPVSSNDVASAVSGNKQLLQLNISEVLAIA
jgi:hypothetical protein